MACVELPLGLQCSNLMLFYGRQSDTPEMRSMTHKQIDSIK